ncbi:BlaI/MecI/CopY family transcriptional regulator [Flavihumibacter profundi]|jgi:BlaI family transcriptional regulator, penicillinase repressor|uniref:BlaI/MecI/CopY family transcriptional regulator n=1 Tax=Flavihumibacter profundi TaxID=2716883 RepID=UPI001CC8067C|nr:BlaI/MecI/CopY family transcriptional regulator [Flavihumibacter profundi]MBZ5857061.1 BlaI/MecI/CopY family transcriptional regulator [Flavihumibacter profundi]
MEKLTTQEEQAMQAAWKTGEGNVKAILESMEPPVPPYTTLASTVKNLEKKGYLQSRLIGNTYIYRPTITEAEYKKGFMGNFIRDYFDNSYKAMVNFFVEQKQLSKKELEEILGMIEGKQQKDQ